MTDAKDAPETHGYDPRGVVEREGEESTLPDDCIDDAERLEDDDLSDDAGTDVVGELVGRGPASVCAWLMLERSLSEAPEARNHAWLRGAALVVRVPHGPWGIECAEVWEILVRAIEPSGGSVADPVAATARARVRRASGTGNETPMIYKVLDARAAREAQDALFRTALRRSRPIHGVSPDPARWLPPELVAAADIVLDVRLPDADLLVDLAAVLAAPAPEARRRLARGIVRGLAATALEAHPAPEVLRRLAHTVTPALISLAHRPGQEAESYLSRLAKLLERQRALAAPPTRVTLTLERLGGHGEAGEWARLAARDLAAYREGRLAWSDVPRGALLVGPPGTGKTLLAQALANSAHVPLVTGSLARWQADDEGHLGTTLKAMRRTFADARLAAPCVMLVDEIDSFGNRASFSRRNRDYSTQVVNALLECLDGAEPRDGVLVVATCNSIKHVDPAILRAGRLDAVLRVPLPDAAALEGMFRLYLGELTATDSQEAAGLAKVARAAEARGATGANVEQWCREARAIAREAGRGVVMADLVAVVGPPPSEPSREMLWRAAVHEAGHALGYLAIGPCTLLGAKLHLDGNSLGVTKVSRDALGHVKLPTRTALLALIRAQLAGRAAELVLLGEASAGAGGSADSDLARATTAAVSLVARSGLSGAPDALVWRGHGRISEAKLLTDPCFRFAVAKILATAHADAESLIRANAERVRRLAETLLVRGEVGAEEAKGVLL